MRRLRHTIIFVLIAGSYTLFGVLMLHALDSAILITTGPPALIGAVFNLPWIDAPG